MFKTIEELHDNITNEGFYPLTHEQAVIDNDDVDLETKLKIIRGSISKRVTNYRENYLTITSLDDWNTISCYTENTENTVVFISVDDGNKWREITVNNDGAVLSTLNNGDNLLIKGDSLTGINLSSTKQFNVSGNIMSLLYGDDFVGQTNLTGYDHAFYGLFKECSGLVNAENLILPATTLSNMCYEEMFNGCINLVSAPSLPSKTMTDTCYGKMFLGCTSLTKAPELPATILMDYCYSSMFEGCTSLIKAPELPATTLASNCYNSMFYGCTGLIEAPELPAMTCVEKCYTYMFHGCTSLSKAPELPSTTVADRCYRYMFAYCTNLTKAPSILPSTTLTIYCYQNMFTGCNSLEIAPELPSLTLVDYCYSQMFDGCGKLRYIKALFTTHPYFAYTDKWVRGVSQTGVFVKNDMATDVRGIDAMPDGWDIYTESEYKTVKKYELNDAIGNIQYPVTSVNGKTGTVILNSDNVKAVHDYSKDYLMFEALENTTFTFTRNALQYSLDGGETWTTLAVNTASPTVTAGNKIMWKQTGLIPAEYEGIGIFSATGRFNISGNIMSLYYGDNFIGQTDLTGKGFAFASLFSYSSELVNAENLILPSTTLAGYCYANMFRGCTSLTSAPELPSTTLAYGCYYRMFEGCISLISAPELPSTTLAGYCYQNMFQSCTSLTKAPELPATTLSAQCYYDMFYGCTSLNYIKCLATDISEFDCTYDWVQNVAATGTFVKADNMTAWSTGNNGIPTGWDVYTESEYKTVKKYELDAAINNIQYPVTSVNGETGDVSLDIPDAQVNSDWNATSGVTQILNAPTNVKNFNIGGHPGIKIDSDTIEIGNSDLSYFVVGSPFSTKNYIYFNEGEDNGLTLHADNEGLTLSSESQIDLNPKSGYKAYYNSKEIAVKDDIQNASAYTTIDLGVLDNFVVDGSWPNGYYEISTVTNLFNTIKTIWDNWKIPIITVSLSNHTASYIIPIYITNSMAMGHTMSRNGGYSIDVEIYDARQVIYTHSIGTYIKPLSGIPSSDLSSEVQESLNKADKAQSKLIYQEITSGSSMTLLVGYDYYMGTGDGEYGPVGTYDFTLDSNPSDGEISVIFTTGSSPAITITSDSPIYVQEGYGIDANATYEMNIKSIRGNYYVVVVKMRLI